MGIKRMQGVSAELEYIGPHGRKSKKIVFFILKVYVKMQR